MSNTWAVLIGIAGLAGSLLINMLAVAWVFGGKTKQYDALGPRIEDMEKTVRQLERQMAAMTGIVNGTSYREE